MRAPLKTTTALVAGLSLLLPGVSAFAQEATLVCPDGTQLPCAEGIEPVPAPEPAAEAPEAAPQEPAAEPVPEETTGAEPAAEPESVLQPEPEPVQVTEPEPVPESAPEPQAEATVEPVPDLTTEPAPEEVAPTPDATALQTADPAAEVPAESPEAQGVIEVPASGPAQTPAPEAVAEGDEAVPAEAVPAETVPDTDAGEPGAAVAETPTVEELERALAGETVPDPEVQPTAEAPPPLPAQPAAETGEAPIADAASLLAPPAAGEAPPPADAPAPEGAVAQVTEETVTETSARSSAEDFANKVNQAAPATTATAPAVVEKDEGLSDVEKLLLLGAGALVVGAIISNNRKVEVNTGDRVVVSRDGYYELIKDDDALLRQPGSKVRTESFRDGSTRTTVLRTDGTRIITIRDAEMRVLRRVHVDRDGFETLLIDDTVAYEPVDIARLTRQQATPAITVAADEAALRDALAYEADIDRRFSLAQIRNIREVRSLMPVIDLDAITFESGSAAIRPDQAKALSRLGAIIRSHVDENPAEIFLIEGHTDAVGGAAYNLALSDRRAESVALALSEYFAVPPENLVVQGYGEEFLKVQTQGDERANRRASVRRITGLLR